MKCKVHTRKSFIVFCYFTYTITKNKIHMRIPEFIFPYFTNTITKYIVHMIIPEFVLCSAALDLVSVSVSLMTESRSVKISFSLGWEAPRQRDITKKMYKSGDLVLHGVSLTKGRRQQLMVRNSVR